MLTAKKPSPRDGKGKGSSAEGGRSGGATSTANKALITRNLRLAYDEIAGEGIPKEMLDLLNQISAKEGAEEEGS